MTTDDKQIAENRGKVIVAYFDSIPNQKILNDEIGLICDTLEIPVFTNLDKSIKYINLSPCGNISTLADVVEVVKENEGNFEDVTMIFSIAPEHLPMLNLTRVIGETKNKIIILANDGDNTALWTYSWEDGISKLGCESGSFDKTDAIVGNAFKERGFNLKRIGYGDELELDECDEEDIGIVPDSDGYAFSVDEEGKLVPCSKADIANFNKRWKEVQSSFEEVEMEMNEIRSRFNFLKDPFGGFPL